MRMIKKLVRKMLVLPVIGTLPADSGVDLDEQAIDKFRQVLRHRKGRYGTILPRCRNTVCNCSVDTLYACNLLQKLHIPENKGKEGYVRRRAVCIDA